MKTLIAFALVMMLAAPGAALAANQQACWGQATQVFARMEPGILGDHSKNQANPRLGLRNLARVLADTGVIPDDSMQSLGLFVLGVLGLEIDECM